VPDVGFALVDVGDVARMHLEALRRPGTAGRRYIAAAGWVQMPQMAGWLAQEFPDRKIATRVAPRWGLRLVSLWDPAVRMILPLLGRRLEVSGARARAEMGIRFTPARETLLRSAQFLVAN
jgi:dihydroflavonol-4-reductase